jgi:rhodanese-related sulfurtransferase
MPHRSDRSRLRSVLVLVAAAGLLLALPACSSSGDGSDAGSAAVTTAAAAAPAPEAAALALEEDRAVIDVRTAEEFDAGHVEGAKLLSLQSETFADDIGALDPDVAYVVYCRTGNRSAQAAEQMRAIGLDVVDGGALADMEAAGWPTSS